MSKQFLKSTEVTLLNGGYLSNKETKKPIYNGVFVSAQNHANYIVTFAKLAKDKDFKGKKADSISDLKMEVHKLLSKQEKIQFVEAPKEVKRPTHDKLAEEALKFMNFEKDKERSEKVNNFLQQFAVLKEFEDFGLFFDEEIVKLDKIYTLEEVVDAVNETIDLLD